VLRADRAYLETGEQALLIDALVVEAGRKLPFYIKISSSRRGSATVRIDPMTHPERSEGVRRLVAEVTADLIARTPGCRLGKGTVLLPSAPDGGEET
jgi:hypothetical protein